MSVLLLTMGPSLGITMLPTSLRVGEPGTITFEVIGAVGSVKWRIVSSSLPAEWDSSLTPSGTSATLDTAEAEVFGTFMVTVTASDDNRYRVTRTFTILVAPAPVTITAPPGEYSWTVGTPVTDTLAISGGTGVYVSAEAPNLPDGVTVGIVGGDLTFSGTPTAVTESTSTTAKVTDSWGAQGVAGIDYKVTNPPMIVLGGEFTTISGVSRGGLAKFSSAGVLQSDLVTTSSASTFAIAVQPDGKTIVGGNFYSYNGVLRQMLVRVNIDGTTDSGFVGYANNYVRGIALQPDGKVVIVGNFTQVNGVSASRIARLNSDGTLDTGFAPSANQRVRCVALQADGKILVGSDSFTQVNGVSRSYLARLNSDGTLDTGFNPAPNSYVFSLAVQPDGKILVGGFFTNIASTAKTRLARLNTDGTIDSSFTNTNNGSIRTIAVKADGKIVIGGDFTTIGGVSNQGCSFLNSDGSRDTSFPDMAVNSPTSVLAVLEQPDGAVLIAGGFQSVQATTRNGVARINADGTLDSGFNPNANNPVNTLAFWYTP